MVHSGAAAQASRAGLVKVMQMSNVVIVLVIGFGVVLELVALALAASVVSNGGSGILKLACVIAVLTPAIVIYVGVNMYRARKRLAPH